MMIMFGGLLEFDRKFSNAENAKQENLENLSTWFELHFPECLLLAKFI